MDSLTWESLKEASLMIMQVPVIILVVAIVYFAATNTPGACMRAARLIRAHKGISMGGFAFSMVCWLIAWILSLRIDMPFPPIMIASLSIGMMFCLAAWAYSVLSGKSRMPAADSFLVAFGCAIFVAAPLLAALPCLMYD